MTAGAVQPRAQASQPSTVGSMAGRTGLLIVLVSVLVFGSAAALLASGSGRDYRARAFVIQVPAALGGGAGVGLARSEGVLRDALSLSRSRDLTVDDLRDRSSAENTSRLDVALTVEADTPERAMLLATSYAKAFKRAIPDDHGLPTRGLGARRAQSDRGPLGWALIAGLAGLGVGAALALVRDGLRRGTARATRRASPPYADAR
jgi:hypothetical protein